MHLVMIGGSDAGISAALRARELDPAADVTVVLDDAYTPISPSAASPTTSPGRSPNGAIWPTTPSPTWRQRECGCGWTPPPAASTCPAAS
jgi:hypothetical protein